VIKPALDKIWPYALIILSVTMIGLGSYYKGAIDTQRQMTSTIMVTATKTVSTTYKVPVGTGLSSVTYNDDFIFQMYLDKFTYKHGEPVTIWFNLTYIGKTPRSIFVDVIMNPMRIIASNTTHTLAGSYFVNYDPEYSYTINPDKSVIAKVTLANKSIYIQSYTPGVPDGGGDFPTLATAGTYNIEGRLDDLGLTSPPLTIMITR